MGQSDDVPGTRQLGYEAWRDFSETMGGRCYLEGTEPDAFVGWVRPVSACGFTALDIGCNAHRIERTYRDARLDCIDHYCTVVPGRWPVSDDPQRSSSATCCG